MNIEESVEYLKNCLNDEYNFKNATRKKDKEAIETLLTAYEKEKGENVKLRLQDIPLIEGELQAYKDRVNELKQELEKEKEKNKELEKQYKILEVEKVRYNIQYLESSISQIPDTVMVYHSIKRDIETLKEQKIKLEKELQELLKEE